MLYLSASNLDSVLQCMLYLSASNLDSVLQCMLYLSASNPDCAVMPYAWLVKMPNYFIKEKLIVSAS